MNTKLVLNALYIVSEIYLVINYLFPSINIISITFIDEYRNYLFYCNIVDFLYKKIQNKLEKERKQKELKNYVNQINKIKF